MLPACFCPFLSIFVACTSCNAECRRRGSGRPQHVRQGPATCMQPEGSCRSRPASCMMGLATVSQTDCAWRAPPKGLRNTSSERGLSVCLRMAAFSAAAQSDAPSPLCSSRTTPLAQPLVADTGLSRSAAVVHEHCTFGYDVDRCRNSQNARGECRCSPLSGTPKLWTSRRTACWPCAQRCG